MHTIKTMQTKSSVIMYIYKVYFTRLFLTTSFYMFVKRPRAMVDRALYKYFIIIISYGTLFAIMFFLNQYNLMC